MCDTLHQPRGHLKHMCHALTIVTAATYSSNYACSKSMSELKCTRHLFPTSKSPTSDADGGGLHCPGYGTYVVRHQSANVISSDCDNASVTMLRALVYSSWAMLAFNW